MPALRFLHPFPQALRGASVTGNAACNAAARLGHDHLQQKDLVGISRADPATAHDTDRLQLPSPKTLSTLSMVFKDRRGEKGRDGWGMLRKCFISH